MNVVLKYLLLFVIRSMFRLTIDTDLVDLLSIGTFSHSKKKCFPKASKTGNYSFKVVGRKNKFKLYGCFSRTWAEQVQRTTQLLQRQGVPIPEVIQRRGKYVLVDWIEGRDIRNDLPLVWCDSYEELVQYQARIHNAQIPEDDHPPISYVNDFLMPRFLKYARPLIGVGQARQVVNCIQVGIESMGDRPFRCSNPDFTHFNIVKTEKGFVVVDNETLHCDALWEYDVLNTANVVFAPIGLKENYLQAYSRYIDISTLFQNGEFWEVLWLVRLAGGSLQTGKKAAGEKYITQLMKKIRSQI